MHALSTEHGTLLCLDRAAERVVHRPLAEIDPADLVFVADPGHHEAGVFEADGRWRVIDMGLRGRSRPTHPRHPTLSVTDGIVRLRYEGGYLVASPDGLIRIDSPEASDWEAFGFVARDAVLDLIAVSRSAWLRLGARARIEADAIALAPRARLTAGGHSYPIAGNFPRPAGDASHGRMVLFRDGWKVDAFRRFRPLVYFVLMGMGAYRDQLALATDSLARYGGYRGDVLLITDRDDDVVLPLIAPPLLERLHVLRIAASDKVDAVLARLMLGEFPDAAAFAPIVYSDTDIVFDRPLLPFLERALLDPGLSGQSEPWNPLPDSSHCGAELFAADPFEFEDRLGFNAGVLSMPGGPDSVRVIDTVRRAMGAYLGEHGRDSLPWLDQAMANYVFRKLECLDAGPVTAATRLCQRGDPPDPDGAAGFVHFWPASARPDERADSMRRYLDLLDAARPAG